VVGVFAISSIPVVGRMFLERTAFTIEWPPYTPPYIAMMRELFAPNEIIASDMPWAVAWYADRRSLWMPYRQEDLIELSDYQRLGGPVGALYFTPISGTQNTLGDLISGEYQNWTRYIVRTVDTAKSPYPVKAVLGMPACVLYMDKERRAGK
jgi:hypothetical protein